jgi:hypothetical protein
MGSPVYQFDMNFWWIVWGVPLLAIAWTIVSLARSNRPPILVGVGFCAALIGAISPSMGIYGLIKINELMKRSYFDYAFEGRAGDFAAVGLVAAIAALLIVRKYRMLYDWAPLVASLWMLLVWTAICATL